MPLLEGLSDARLIAAIAIVIVYAAFTLYCLSGVGARRPPTCGAPPAARDATLIAFASQTGFAQQLAQQTAQSLQSTGRAVRVASFADLGTADLAGADRALFIVSTTGEGDAPDPAVAFVRKVLDRKVPLANLRYGLLALGDREYQNFCAFGHRLDRWLRHQGAQTLFDVVEVDNGDDGALRHWQHNLSLAFSAPDLPDWEAPAYERWRLASRQCVNPDSAGDPCFHIVLEPIDGTFAWQAGDIAEIDPFNSHARGGQHHPHREYSIASIPEDGALHLLVRQMRRPSGELGLGSGWLTQGAPVGGDIFVRIRANLNFHLPANDAPLIMIGNGTGIAGLRALMKTRVARGQRRNWLVFGERNAAYDRFYEADLQRWRDAGFLPKLDLVYSRDQPQRRYVQHRLAECATDLREWIGEGAYLYVCGSLEGMAPGVHAALIDTLGEAAVDALTVDGRYRRDVY
jgi:sulfite reductase (NADPH) flavoprotein alpha-component